MGTVMVDSSALLSRASSGKAKTDSLSILGASLRLAGLLDDAYRVLLDVSDGADLKVMQKLQILQFK